MIKLPVLADAPSSYMTDTLFACLGLPMTVGKAGAGRRDLRGAGARAGEFGPLGTPTAFWKLGRRSSGGMAGGAAEIFERNVLVDVWLVERLRGLLMNALCTGEGAEPLPVPYCQAVGSLIICSPRVDVTYRTGQMS